MTRGSRGSRARPLARRSFAALPAPTVAEAAEDVARARVTLDRVRRDVAHRRDGSASLTAAEHGLHVALRRYEQAAGLDTDPPEEAA